MGMTLDHEPAITVRTKYAAEARLYTFDFATLGEFHDLSQTLASAVVTSATVGLTLGTVAVSGSQAQLTISGGTAGVAYTLTCLGTTSGSAVVELKGVLQVV